ncbi:MAG: CDP-alcohol phosphatidyltransferase family protein [Anaerolineae bacterium]|nr:CDP-alcohol phosphatidyltransferase family protein [Anaerolineae bacterium]
MSGFRIGEHETLTDWVRAQAVVITTPVAQFLNRLGLHPNTVTILGMLLTVGVGVVIATGRLHLGGALLLATSALDSLDGALARLTNRKTRFGAFLDSTLDRISEGALFWGLLMWAVPQSLYLESSLILLCLLGSLMVSYIRARAEGVGYACKVGVFTRMERVLMLGVCLMLGWVRPMLWLMTALVWFTVIQRMLHVYQESLRNP